MSKKTERLQVICPCCQAKLLVEPTTGLVLKSQEKKLDYSLEGALQEEKKKRDQADDLFDQVFQDEKRRQDVLQEKFRKALDSKDELEDPTRPWDYD
jgi:hypothetical protein